MDTVSDGHPPIRGQNPIPSTDQRFSYIEVSDKWTLCQLWTLAVVQWSVLRMTSNNAQQFLALVFARDSVCAVLMIRKSRSIAPYIVHHLLGVKERWTDGCVCVYMSETGWCVFGSNRIQGPAVINVLY